MTFETSAFLCSEKVTECIDGIVPVSCNQRLPARPEILFITKKLQNCFSHGRRRRLSVQSQKFLTYLWWLHSTSNAVGCRRRSDQIKTWNSFGYCSKIFKERNIFYRSVNRTDRYTNLEILLRMNKATVQDFSHCIGRPSASSFLNLRQVRSGKWGHLVVAFSVKN